MKRLSVVLILFFLGFTAQAATWAQFALGGGYDAVFMVTNKTAFPWSGTIKIYQGYNLSWSGRWYVNGSEFTGSTGFIVSLAPYATSKFTITGDPNLRTGYMDFNGDSGYYDSDTTYSFFYNLRTSSGDLLETIGGPESPESKKMIFPVEKSAKVDTGYAICPMSRYSTTSFPMVLTLYNHDGTVYATKQVSFTGHQAIFVSQVFDMPQDFIGFLKVDGQTYFYMTVLRMEYNAAGWQFTSVTPDNYVSF